MKVEDKGDVKGVIIAVCGGDVEAKPEVTGGVEGEV